MSELETKQDREPGEVDLSELFKCPICDKFFWTSIDLADHLKRVGYHMEERK